MDTACSSSLVAVLWPARASGRVVARRARLRRERHLLTADLISLSKVQMLAPDGRCKTFDAAADGFARGEGCGVLVLKRLATRRPTAIRSLPSCGGRQLNQDGRSGGLTAPNGPAQEAVIRAALPRRPRARRHRLRRGARHRHVARRSDRGSCDCICTWRKSRSQKDPFSSVPSKRTSAICGIYRGRGRRCDQGRLGPATRPHSAAFAFPQSKSAHPVEHHSGASHERWCGLARQGARKRRAGVSSFGFSGSNAHVILEEAPIADHAKPPALNGFHCLPLSARSSSALATLAGNAGLVVSDPTVELSAMARWAGGGRAHHAHRLAIVADDRATMRSALQAATKGAAHPALLRREVVPGQRPDVVFLFAGPGARYRGMGREFYDAHPVFRAVIDECDAVLGRDAQGRSLKRVLWEMSRR